VTLQEQELDMWDEYQRDMANQTGFGHTSCYQTSRRDFTGYKDYQIAIHSFEVESVRRNLLRCEIAIEAALSALTPLRNSPNPSVMSIRDAIDILSRR
jgi:hypothetical protein